MWGLLAGPIAEVLGKVIDGVIPDRNEAERIKQETMARLLAHEGAELEARARIVLAEAGGESWLQRNWRPILMLVIVAIVANNYLVAPYLEALGLPSRDLDLPDQLWNLMKIGVGGYVVGRSGEKIARVWRAAQ